MKIYKIIALFAITLISNASNAATFNFTGNITYHNDVVVTGFTLNSEATNVRVWTDSFMSGTNFDPITALWDANTGALISQNDDNQYVNPTTQTYYDSGFTLTTLAAGDYFFTVGTYANFASGSNISDGFGYDNQSPILMADWCQPANHCNMGTAWSVWLDGVDSAVNNSVPEPSIIALLGLGLAGIGFTRRKQKKVS